MNFVHGVFYIAIFSNMAQRQRARYRVARYVIVNNVTTATLESTCKDEERMKTSLTEEKWKQFEQPLFGRFELFQRWGSSTSNNHSAITVSKFILALSIQFEFCFILWLFFLTE